MNRNHGSKVKVGLGKQTEVRVDQRTSSVCLRSQ